MLDQSFQNNSLTPNRQETLQRIWICAGLFGLLVIWLYFWPYTGDGDSMLHYWNLRHSWLSPSDGLTSWARPVYVLLMVLPARGGVFAARIFTALLTIIAAWQTMRLADDLNIPNATLAGPLLIFQPLVFALASDTMTEMPMALGIVIALRLWFARQFALSCLLVSFLPFVRPEGFFIAPIWGLFLLFLPLKPENPALWKRFVIGSLLATGLICLVAVCYFVTNDYLYFAHTWSWPVNNPAFGRGTLWHHFVRWPAYCGWILFPLFVAGIIPSIRKEMALPWAIWGTVIMVHTIMHWRGVFGAIGLMRILASTSAVTVLIMLYGWNWLTQTEVYLKQSLNFKRYAPVTVMLLAAATAMFYYYADPTHHRCFRVIEAARFVRQNNLLTQSPRFFVGDTMTLAALDYPDQSPQYVVNNFDKKEQLKMLAELPSGSVGVWDNMQGQMWFQVSPDELAQLGYTTLYESKQQVSAYHFDEWLLGFNYWSMPQRYIVVRKN